MPERSTSATSEVAAFRRRLRAWYREHGRHDLPWRLTRDPYAVLISEVMLQQTQVDRVLPYYRRWLERWPGFAALAASPPSEVIREWRGLGYNRRALGLHRLADAVMEQHGGGLPARSPLRELPGVGPYTESAVRCFAWAARVPVADTNIARVLARARRGFATRHDAPPGELRAAAEEMLPTRDARAHNFALMDLGAVVCTARKPRCEECPVAAGCRWRQAGYPAPAAPVRPAPKFETTARFARGRIVDALREAPATAGQLQAMLPVAHSHRLPAYLAALAKDGLVVKHRRTWALPT